MVTFGVMAQGHMSGQVNTYSDEGDGTGFKKQNLFVGGGLGLGFGSYNFNVGINPEVGYSLNHWLDVGVLTNFTYESEKADPDYIINPDTRTHEFVYGGGAFARAWFLPFLFATVQPEFNWTSVNETFPDGEVYKYNANAPSVIVGLGYGQRNVGQGSFYLMVGLDVCRSKNSPYNDYNGNPMPVIRAGFDVFVHKR